VVGFGKGVVLVPLLAAVCWRDSGQFCSSSELEMLKMSLQGEEKEKGILLNHS